MISKRSSIPNISSLTKIDLGDYEPYELSDEYEPHKPYGIKATSKKGLISTCRRISPTSRKKIGNIFQYLHQRKSLSFINFVKLVTCLGFPCISENYIKKLYKNLVQKHRRLFFKKKIGSKPFACKLCKKASFDFPEELRQHSVKEHDDDGKNRVDEVCVELRNSFNEYIGLSGFKQAAVLSFFEKEYKRKLAF